MIVEFSGQRRRVEWREIRLRRGMLIAIDPGRDGMGVAFFDEEGKLMCAGIAPIVDVSREDVSTASIEGALAGLRGMCAWGSLHAFDARVVIERPVVLPPQAKAKRKARPADVVTLALIAGGAVGIAGKLARAYEPRTWKGSTDADAFVEIVKSRWVSEEERSLVVLPSASLEHNVWDAVGLGIFHLRATGVRS